MWRVVIALLFSVGNTIAGGGIPPPAKHEVLSLPGWSDPTTGKPKKLPSRMYTGYLDAGTPPSGALGAVLAGQYDGSLVLSELCDTAT